MKKHILTIIAISLIFGAMIASVQTVYADEVPEGCIAFTSSQAFSVSLGNSKTGRTWDGVVQVSVDGTDWQDYMAGTTIDSEISSNGEYSVFFRGEGNSHICDYTQGTLFQLTGEKISCSGNIENLLDHTEVQENKHPKMSEYAFYALFERCTSLIEAPELPATTLADACYAAMFQGCKSLTKAPELPATTLADSCYAKMFNGCTSLTEAPELRATTLAVNCYGYMFENCTSLTVAPELPATTLADSCYLAMFRRCTSLTAAPALPATMLANGCYHYMFSESGVKISVEKGISNGVLYGIAYQIPKEGGGMYDPDSFYQMFDATGDLFTGTPEMNTTYYLATPGWTGNGTKEEPFVISDAIGWNTLMKFVNTGYNMESLFFCLGDNIEVTEMVGTYEKPFSGSFDGAGKTLTFKADDAPEICAPFVYVKDASFKNLHIEGTIKTGQQFAAGLIGHFDGTVNVENCQCSIVIDSSVNGDGTHGGFIAAGERNGAACFEGCVFDGKLLGPETTRCGGFIGWANPTDKTYTIKDCMFAPKELTLKSDLFNFIRKAPESTIIQNSYYTKNIGDNSQGKAVRLINADVGITVGSADATVYSVSGITAFDTGLAYGNAFYAGKDDKVTVTIQSVCDGITASAGTITRVDAATGAGAAFTMTMPDKDVTLTLNKGANHKWGEVTYTWSNDNSQVKAEHTCTRAGCGATEDETVNVTAQVTTEPGCETKGKTTYTSEAFKNKAFEVQKKTLEDIPAAEHKWKDATCTDPKTCEVCQATEGEALGHAWGAWAPLDENQHQRVCGNDPGHKETGDHAWDEGIVTREATKEEAGEKLFTCGVCGAIRTEVIPVDDTPVDPDIPVIDIAELKTVGNFARKEMKIFFPADAAVTNYQIQYRMAGETEWQVGWSDGTNTYTFRGMDKSSLCEFRIAGFVVLENGSWVRGEWSDISYRYMKSVKLKSAKAGKKRIALKWAKDKKGSGYQIKYFTDKNIHMADADTITIKGKKKTKYTIKPLQKGQTYYVRIRPIKIRNGIEYQGILKNTKKAKVK